MSILLYVLFEAKTSPTVQFPVSLLIKNVSCVADFNGDTVCVVVVIVLHKLLDGGEESNKILIEPYNYIETRK